MTMIVVAWPKAMRIKFCEGEATGSFLGCIKCMRCSLLLPMIAVFVCQSVCVSSGSIRLHCAKTAKQIKMLFGANTFASRIDIVLDGGLNFPTARRGEFDAAFA